MVSSFAVPTLEEIRRALATRVPETVDPAGCARAAVATVLHSASSGLEVLFIERAEHSGDPWSGHMAFPGGRQEPDERDPRGVAERETFEEVGLDLSGAEFLGRLGDLQGRRTAGVSALVISGFVYHLAEVSPLRHNHEENTAFWFPLEALHERVRRVSYVLPVPGELAFPGIRVGEAEPHVVWGLTYRFLEVFFAAVGQPLPDRWGALQGFAP
jgi:8-oxo-dGTP pyrophosphatase MutT (NUDIX family)